MTLLFIIICLLFKCFYLTSSSCGRQKKIISFIVVEMWFLRKEIKFLFILRVFS